MPERPGQIVSSVPRGKSDHVTFKLETVEGEASVGVIKGFRADKGHVEDVTLLSEVGLADTDYPLPGVKLGLGGHENGKFFSNPDTDRAGIVDQLVAAGHVFGVELVVLDSVGDVERDW